LNKANGTRISRADAAAFMLEEVQEGRYVQKAPVISN
jgi:putative NADH-flavin reductase